MRCPYCGHEHDKVVDSRSSNNGLAIRRRRECADCSRRYTTYEHIEEVGLMVIKKDGRREAFDRGKILAGLKRACEKRPISMDVLESGVESIEQSLQQGNEKEVKTEQIGELVISYLHNLDEVAYVRFASVYRQFKDINQFMQELKDLLALEVTPAKK